MESNTGKCLLVGHRRNQYVVGCRVNLTDTMIPDPICVFFLHKNIFAGSDSEQYIISWTKHCFFLLLTLLLPRKDKKPDKLFPDH